MRPPFPAFSTLRSRSLKAVRRNRSTRPLLLPAIFLSAAISLPFTIALSQVPDAPAPAPAAAPAPAPASPGASTAGPSGAGSSQGGNLGKETPFFDPGSEIVTWDGKNWNINNNRLFDARFEKYLNAPEETTAEARQYQEILNTILNKLSSENLTSQSLDDAFRLLPKGSNFDIDARLCDTIADAVYSAWRSQDAGDRLARANESLEQERRAHERNAKVAAESTQLDAPPKSKDAIAEWQKEEDMKRDAEMQPYVTRLAEVMALIKANQLKREFTSIQAKVEFQALMVQLFFQRRFQHVLIASRFYRAIFTDGDTQLRVGNDAKDLFSKTTGMPPTVGTLDSMANEAIRDVREGVQAYRFLLQKDELESATKRLAEAFSVGEYLPEIRTLPRDDKRKALEFTQQSNQLISALEVKDYTLAEKLVKQLGVTAKDFDNSKPVAAIETARTISAMHLAKAKNAAIGGDKQVLEDELRAATEIWPGNPALAEVSGMIMSEGDLQHKAIIDLDQLISQHNYRQIYDDKIRFMAASALYPDRKQQLEKVLNEMQTIEGAIMRSTEIARHGDAAGAWESVEKVFQQYPDDIKLNQIRANLATDAADFVRTLRTAEDLERKEQTGASLAWYLKAQKIYPASEFAEDGIQRLSKEIIPEG